MIIAQKEPSQIYKDLLAKKLVEPDLLEVEELCKMARCQLCEVARVNPDFEQYNTIGPRLDKPDKSYSRSLPSLLLYERVVSILIKNQVGSIKSYKKSTCLRLYKEVVPTYLRLYEKVGSILDREASHLLDLI